VAEPSKSDDQDLPTLVSELRDLVVRYAKQEALDPILALKRYVGWGLAGAVLLAVGLPLLLLGALRAIELETSPHLGGNLSWIPYFAVTVVSGVIMYLLVRGIGAAKRRADRERDGLRKRG
jgi:hypothetical protein